MIRVQARRTTVASRARHGVPRIPGNLLHRAQMAARLPGSTPSGASRRSPGRTRHNVFFQRGQHGVRLPAVALHQEPYQRCGLPAFREIRHGSRCRPTLPVAVRRGGTVSLPLRSPDARPVNADRRHGDHVRHGPPPHLAPDDQVLVRTLRHQFHHPVSTGLVIGFQFGVNGSYSSSARSIGPRCST